MTKAIVKNIFQLVNILSDGNVYIFSFHVSDEINRYIFYLYDEHFKYVCECRNMTSFDIRMLRRFFDNLYYWNDELEELAQIFGKTTVKNVNK